MCAKKNKTKQKLNWLAFLVPEIQQSNRCAQPCCLHSGLFSLQALSIKVTIPLEVFVSVPLILSSTGISLIRTRSHWPSISDHKSDKNLESDGYVESTSICHMALNRNTNIKQHSTHTLQMTEVVKAQYSWDSTILKWMAYNTFNFVSVNRVHLNSLT